MLIKLGTQILLLSESNRKSAPDTRRTKKKTRVGQVPSEGLFLKSNEVDGVLFRLLVCAVEVDVV